MSHAVNMVLLQAEWALFFGRFHPVLVHLPIGFLLIALLLEIGNRWKKVEVKDNIISFILLWATLGAIISCVAGYLLSLGGGYDEQLLEKHKWQGLWVAAISAVAWLVKSNILFKTIPKISLLYWPALLSGSVLLMIAGHHGGSLTHGEGYLTQATPQPFRSWIGMAPAVAAEEKIQPISDINKAMVYQDVVRPILKQNCVQCHNANKSKGDLRMDDIGLLQKGGKNGVVFKVGNSTESEMIKRCLLPLEDENHMPPKGKPQPTEQQLTLLKWWIDEGASFDKKLVDLKPSDAIKPILTTLVVGAVTVAMATESESPILKLKVAEPDKNAVASLKQINLLVMPLSSDTPNLLEVNAVNNSDFNDTQIKLLTPLSAQIVWLNLSKTKITDKAIEAIAQLKNVEKLHLENTSITDVSLKNLQSLPYLSYLNLVGTTVTDAGLKALAGCKSLKKIYVWQSKVTDAGVAELLKTLPNVDVVLGTNESQIAEFVKLGEKAPKPIEVKK